jgi:hypothetical protein
MCPLPPPSNASSSNGCAMFVGAKFISPAPLNPLTLKGYHHDGGVREDADLLVTPYTARCAGYGPKI